jgi:phosphate starvation-inducible PhoH-like protein
MGRRFERKSVARNRKGGLLPLMTDETPAIQHRGERVIKPLAALNDNQDRYIKAIAHNQITIGLGPAGTGKTYIAAALAAEAFKTGVIRKIIVTRPAVEAGESLGFLPGELEEKYEPYFRPVRDAFVERLGSGPTDYMIKSGQIEAIPLAYLRGMTFKDAWVILDEAQNTTPLQMKLFLTRIGENAKVIINGDLSQQDIPGYSGLDDASKRLRGLGGVAQVAFDENDIVRSGIVADILRRYANALPSAERYTEFNSKDDFEGLVRMMAGSASR